MKGAHEACTDSLRSRFSCRSIRVLRGTAALIAVFSSCAFAAAAENGKATGHRRSASPHAVQVGFHRLERGGDSRFSMRRICNNRMRYRNGMLVSLYENPAKLIRYRDMNHYNKLKAEGKFM